jgi:hypothetical protein
MCVWEYKIYHFQLAPTINRRTQMFLGLNCGKRKENNLHHNSIKGSLVTNDVTDLPQMNGRDKGSVFLIF